MTAFYFRLLTFGLQRAPGSLRRHAFKDPFVRVVADEAIDKFAMSAIGPKQT